MNHEFEDDILKNIEKREKNESPAFVQWICCRKSLQGNPYRGNRFPVGESSAL